MGGLSNKMPGLGILQRIACHFGQHHRDGNNVRRVAKQWRSVCTGCGASMVKTDDGWIRRIDLPDDERPKPTRSHTL